MIVGAVACGAIGATITYFLAQRGVILANRKTSAEADGVYLDNRTKYYEAVQKLKQTAERLKADRDQMTGLLAEIAGFLRQNKKRGLKTAREELCHFYSSQYIESLKDYVNECPLLLNKRDCRDRMIGEAIPALLNMEKFLGAVNNENLLGKIGNPAALLLRKESVEIIFGSVRRNVPFFTRIRHRWTLFRLQRRLHKYLRQS